MTKKAVIIIKLVPESEEISSKQIRKEIKETIRCGWLLEVEKVTIR